MKKYTLLAIIIILFSNCKREIILKLSVGTEFSKLTKKYLNEFEKENPGVRVIPARMPNIKDIPLHESYQSFLATGNNDLDLFSIDIIWIQEFWQSGWILDLAPYYSEKEKSEYLYPLISAAKIGNHLVGIPGMVDTGLLFYRKDKLKKSPASWKKLIKAGRKYKKKMPYPLLFPGDNYESLLCFYFEIIFSLTDNIQNIERKHISESIKILNSLLPSKVKYQKKISTFRENEIQNLFLKDKSLFLRNWPYMISILNKSKLKNKYAIAPLPGNSSILGGWFMVVSATSKHPVMAVKLLKFLNHKKRQKEQSIASGKFPALHSLYKDKDLIQKIPHLQKVFSILSKAKYRPKMENYSSISYLIANELHAFISKKQSPKKTVNKIIKIFANLKLSKTTNKKNKEIK